MQWSFFPMGLLVLINNVDELESSGTSNEMIGDANGSIRKRSLHRGYSELYFSDLILFMSYRRTNFWNYDRIYVGRCYFTNTNFFNSCGTAITNCNSNFWSFSVHCS
jgi:hypothetical protein